MSVKDRMEGMYAAGNVPWDDPLPPPEVIEVVQELRTGRALDLGCGFGRAAIYLAGSGWQVDAVDFVEMAIEVARKRAADAGVSVNFIQGDVMDLPSLAGPYDLVLDVGCAHSLEPEQFEIYVNEVARLVRGGGTYLLFVRLRESVVGGDGPRGLEDAMVLQSFSGDFSLSKVERNLDLSSPNNSWPSAWYWFTRRDVTSE